MSVKNLKLFFSYLTYIFLLPFSFYSKPKIEDIEELKNIIVIKNNEIKELNSKLRNYAECSEKIIKNIYNDKHNKEDEIVQLKNNIKDITSLFQEQNHKNYEKISILEQKIQENKTENLCSICVENKINICCFPCGHTYCDRCILNANNCCYICRERIIMFNKIYI